MTVNQGSQDPYANCVGVRCRHSVTEGVRVTDLQAGDGPHGDPVTDRMLARWHLEEQDQETDDSGDGGEPAEQLGSPDLPPQ